MSSWPNFATVSATKSFDGGLIGNVGLDGNGSGAGLARPSRTTSSAWSLMRAVVDDDFRPGPAEGDGRARPIPRLAPVMTSNSALKVHADMAISRADMSQPDCRTGECPRITARMLPVAQAVPQAADVAFCRSRFGVESDLPQGRNFFPQTLDPAARLGRIGQVVTTLRQYSLPTQPLRTAR